ATLIRPEPQALGEHLLVGEVVAADHVELDRLPAPPKLGARRRRVAIAESEVVQKRSEAALPVDESAVAIECGVGEGCHVVRQHIRSRVSDHRSQGFCTLRLCQLMSRSCAGSISGPTSGSPCPLFGSSLSRSGTRTSPPTSLRATCCSRPRRRTPVASPPSSRRRSRRSSVSRAESPCSRATSSRPP